MPVGLVVYRRRRRKTTSSSSSGGGGVASYVGRGAVPCDVIHRPERQRRSPLMLRLVRPGIALCLPFVTPEIST